MGKNNLFIKVLVFLLGFVNLSAQVSAIDILEKAKDNALMLDNAFYKFNITSEIENNLLPIDGEFYIKGEKYLMENESKKGVTTLASGLQYEVVEMGEGEKPNLDSTVVVHYRGTLIDGTEFDSSYARGEPIEFKLNQVIQGWQEVLQLMPIGSKWKATIPSDLAYGERGAGSTIGPNSTLLFDIELLDIK